MNEFNDIIERLKDAVPDQKTDQMIAEALGFRLARAAYAVMPAARFISLPYTSSVDAALTLVPETEGVTWNLGKWISKSGDGTPVYWADVHGYGHYQGRHAYAAIAMCIAALQLLQSRRRMLLDIGSMLQSTQHLFGCRHDENR